MNRLVGRQVAELDVVVGVEPRKQIRPPNCARSSKVGADQPVPIGCVKRELVRIDEKTNHDSEKQHDACEEDDNEELNTPGIWVDNLLRRSTQKPRSSVLCPGLRANQYQHPRNYDCQKYKENDRHDKQKPLKTGFLAKSTTQPRSDSQQGTDQTGYSSKSAKKTFCLWCRLHLPEKNAQPIWRCRNRLRTPENDYVDYDPPENRNEDPSRRSPPPLAILILCHPTRQAGKQEINQQQHAEDQRGRENHVFDRITRGRRQRETLGKLIWFTLQCTDFIVRYARRTLRRLDGVYFADFRNFNPGACCEFRFLSIPRSWPGSRERLAIVLQSVLNRKLLVWFQFHRTEIVLADAPLLLRCFDGISSLDLSNDALSALWDLYFLLTPWDGRCLEALGQRKLNGRF